MNMTSTSCGNAASTGTLYRTENTGRSRTWVNNRKRVFAASLARKMANGSLTERRSALSVSLFCSRKKAGLQHQRSREKKSQPQQSRAKAARVADRWIECEAEEHHNREDEDHRRGEKLSRAELRAKFLAKQDRRIGEQRHSRVRKGEDRAKVRTG